MSAKDNLKYVKTIFKLSSYLPSHKTPRTFFFKLILTPIMSTLCLFVVFKFRDMHHDIFEIATIFESLSTHGHVFSRKLAVLKHAVLIEELINDRRFFWRYDLFGEVVSAAFGRKMSTRNLIIKSLSAISVLMLGYFYLTPVFVRSVELPQASWHPGNGGVSRGIMYFLQILCLSESIPVAVIIDGTFLLMCGEMEIQFVLLKKTLQSVRIGGTREDTSYRKLKMCSRYHAFLLQEHDKMKKIFSEFFLLQFLLSIEGLCIEIFVINKAQTWGQFTIAAIYIAGIIMQSSFTFLSASNLEIEVENLTDVIYDIDWYNTTDPRLSKHILFMMMRSQKPVRLTGAGLLDVNRNMLLQIMRTGFSISAIIRQT